MSRVMCFPLHHHPAPCLKAQVLQTILIARRRADRHNRRRLLAPAGLEGAHPPAGVGLQPLPTVPIVASTLAAPADPAKPPQFAPQPAVLMGVKVEDVPDAVRPRIASSPTASRQRGDARANASAKLSAGSMVKDRPESAETSVT